MQAVSFSLERGLVPPRLDSCSRDWRQHSRLTLIFLNPNPSLTFPNPNPGCLSFLEQESNKMVQERMVVDRKQAISTQAQVNRLLWTTQVPTEESVRSKGKRPANIHVSVWGVWAVEAASFDCSRLQSLHSFALSSSQRLELNTYRAFFQESNFECNEVNTCKGLSSFTRLQFKVVMKLSKMEPESRQHYQLQRVETAS